MQKVTPFIWFEDQARAAAEWYVSLFPNSRIASRVTLPGTPSGDTEIVSLSLNGTDFQFMSAGKMADRNSSFSCMVACETVEEVDRLWNALIEGGEAMMPIQEYPFSKRYGWLTDRYGVGWQIMHDGGMRDIRRISPALLFVGDVCGKAEEAMNLYCATLGGAPLDGHISRYPAGAGPDKEGTLNYARFSVAGSEIVAMDSALDHKFSFNEMQSFVVRCDDQAEMDRLYAALSHVPEAEQCGWLKDKFGVSWQLVSYRFEEMMTTGTPEAIARMTQAFLPMKRLDLAAIEKAFRGEA